MPQTTHNVIANTRAPLATLNLLLAGVPCDEVVWFRRLKPDRQMAALTTTRGALLLEKVRQYVAGSRIHASGAGD